MQITFQMDGGLARFPGLARPISFSDADLSPGERDELRQLIDKAGFFDAPEADPSRSAGADIQRYVVTIVEGARSHVLRRHDPVQPQALADLVTFVRKKAMSVLRARAQP